MAKYMCGLHLNKSVRVPKDSRGHTMEHYPIKRPTFTVRSLGLDELNQCRFCERRAVWSVSVTYALVKS